MAIPSGVSRRSFLRTSVSVCGAVALDELLVTEKGAELLTPQSPSLEEPFGNVF